MTDLEALPQEVGAGDTRPKGTTESDFYLGWSSLQHFNAMVEEMRRDNPAAVSPRAGWA